MQTAGCQLPATTCCMSQGSRKLCVLQEFAGRSALEPGRKLPPPVFLPHPLNIVPAGKGKIQVPSLFSWGRHRRVDIWMTWMDVRVNILIYKIFPVSQYWKVSRGICYCSIATVPFHLPTPMVAVKLLVPGTKDTT